jgi:hypothetical protein
VVVAVGLMLVEPLADVDVNVPGVIAIPVAPAAAQLSVLVVPEFMLVGFAAKDVIVGAEPFSVGELDEVAAPQPARPTEKNCVKTRAQRPSPEELSSREQSLFLPIECGEPIGNPFGTAGHTSLVVRHLSCPLVASTESGRWFTSGNLAVGSRASSEPV